MLAAKELGNLKFKITKAERSLIKEYEGKMWPRNHHDFFTNKCLGLLKARPELLRK